MIISASVIVGVLLVWRPLLFASVDPVVAAARGVPDPVPLGLLHDLARVGDGRVGAARRVVAVVLSVLVTPALAARRITASPVLMPLLSVAVAVAAMVGGVMLASEVWSRSART